MKPLIVASYLALTAAAFLFWVDYSFNPFGGEPSIGSSTILDTPVKTIYVAIALLVAGIVGIWKARPKA